MKKLNNKGMTLVEIIVTFAILMVIVLEMVNLSVDVNNKSKINEFKKELTEYSNNIRKTIQNDMIVLNVRKIEQNPTNQSYILEFEDKTIKELIIKNNVIIYDNELYKFKDSEYLDFKYTGTTTSEDIITINLEITENLYDNDDTNYGFKIVHVIEK